MLRDGRTLAIAARILLKNDFAGAVIRKDLSAGSAEMMVVVRK